MTITPHLFRNLLKKIYTTQRGRGIKHLKVQSITDLLELIIWVDLRHCATLGHILGKTNRKTKYMKKQFRITTRVVNVKQF